MTLKGPNFNKKKSHTHKQTRFVSFFMLCDFLNTYCDLLPYKTSSPPKYNYLYTLTTKRLQRHFSRGCKTRSHHLWCPITPLLLSSPFCVYHRRREKSFYWQSNNRYRGDRAWRTEVIVQVGLNETNATVCLLMAKCYLQTLIFSYHFKAIVD